MYPLESINISKQWVAGHRRKPDKLGEAWHEATLSVALGLGSASS